MVEVDFVFSAHFLPRFGNGPVPVIILDEQGCKLLHGRITP